jgi:hypothetical protein
MATDLVQQMVIPSVSWKEYAWELVMVPYLVC